MRHLDKSKLLIRFPILSQFFLKIYYGWRLLDFEFCPQCFVDMWSYLARKINSYSKFPHGRWSENPQDSELYFFVRNSFTYHSEIVPSSAFCESYTCIFCTALYNLTSILAFAVHNVRKVELLLWLYRITMNIINFSVQYSTGTWIS